MGLVCGSPFGRVKRSLRPRQNHQRRPLGVCLPAIRNGIDRPAASAIQLVPQRPAELAAHQCAVREHGVVGSGADKHWTAGIQVFGGSFIGLRPGRPAGRLCHALAFRGKRNPLATVPDITRGMTPGTSGH